MTKYCSFEDVAKLGGFRVDDMDFLGLEMELPDYKDLIDTFIGAASNIVNRYCNVESFFPHAIEDEFHSMTCVDMYSNTYGVWRPFSMYSDYITDTEKEHVSSVYPMEQPVQSISKVEINLVRNLGYAPQWIELHEYGVPYIDSEGKERIGEDYQVVSRFGTTYIYLIYRYPAYGKNNIKISYEAGYKEDGDELKNIRIATAMIVNNFLINKKKVQEVATIRGAGIQDYSPMFNDITQGLLLTPEVKMILDMYRRQPLDPSMYE